uniref:Uncharacterized protein n=1 Tax=uncultured marine virus TaxID=186617 RepID=A0A0F7L8M6_9VIRU|nr:hypothetical protein TMO_0051 [uncultured marine virus]
MLLIERILNRIKHAQDTEESPDNGAFDDIQADPQDKNNTPDPTPSDKDGLLGGAADEEAGKNKDPKAPDPNEDPKGDRPDHIPEQFWDKDKKEVNTEAMAKSYTDLRAEFNKVQKEKGGKPGKALESPEAYLTDFETPSKAKGEDGQEIELDRVRDIPTDDPALIALSKVAKAKGWSKEDFNDVITEVLAAANGNLPEPFNRENEITALGGEEKAIPMIRTNQGWVLHLHKNGILNEDQYNHALNFGKTAIGVETLNAIRVNSGEKPIPTGASVNTGAKTPTECQAMMADERYSKDGPEGDAYRAEVDAAFLETYGE